MAVSDDGSNRDSSRRSSSSTNDDDSEGNNAASTTKSSSSSSRSSLKKSPRSDLIDILAGKVVKVALQNVDEPIQNVLDTRLPTSPSSVRALPFYDSIWNTIQFQRDQYLVGSTYATTQQQERQRRRLSDDDYDDEYDSNNDIHSQDSNDDRVPTFATPFGRKPNPFLSGTTTTSSHTLLPFDSTTLGHIQIVNIGQSFIPSTTVQTALLPIIVGLPVQNVSLYRTITDTVSNSIPLAQPPVNNAVKNVILSFMKNQTMRQVIKNRTQGILGVSNTNVSISNNVNYSDSSKNDTQ